MVTLPALEGVNGMLMVAVFPARATLRTVVSG